MHGLECETYFSSYIFNQSLFKIQGFYFHLNRFNGFHLKGVWNIGIIFTLIVSVALT